MNRRLRRGGSAGRAAAAGPECPAVIGTLEKREPCLDPRDRSTRADSLAARHSASALLGADWRFREPCEWFQPVGQNVGAELLLDLSGGNFNGVGYTQIAHAPGRPNDLFVARQDGIISRIDLTTKMQSTFFTLPGADVDTGQYWGLLGFTFAPDFATSGDLYVHVAGRSTESGHASAGTISSPNLYPAVLTHNPLSNTPTAGSSTNILRWAQPRPTIAVVGLDFIQMILTRCGSPVATAAITTATATHCVPGRIRSDLLSGILRINVAGTGAGEFGKYSIPLNNPFGPMRPVQNWAPEI